MRKLFLLSMLLVSFISLSQSKKQKSIINLEEKKTFCDPHWSSRVDFIYPVSLFCTKFPVTQEGHAFIVKSLDSTAMTSHARFGKGIYVKTDSIIEVRLTPFTTDDLAEGTDKKYYTDARTRSAISLTTTGSGAATYNNSTGVLNMPTPTAYTPPARVFNNSPSRSFVTSNTATGFQISSTRDANVSYSVTIGTAISLSGNSSGYVVLETASTNSTTASDWVEISRITSQKGGGLVIGLSLTDTNGATLSGIIQYGYYVRIRTVSTSGTPTFTNGVQREVQL